RPARSTAGLDGAAQLQNSVDLPFDEKAGLVWASLMAGGKAKGRPRSALDTIIAAIAEANHYVVVTDNEKDFEDVQIINPIRSSGS
ncbi:VapC toxin family PIN domain ribonuclease, partial [Mesorhizobium sp. VK22E]|nr:VapC toxin family PIN domain ribonuclease [Mesorhizobium sp. VK22E]